MIWIMILAMYFAVGVVVALHEGDDLEDGILTTFVWPIIFVVAYKDRMLFRTQVQKSGKGSVNIQAKGDITIDGEKITATDQYGCDYEIDSSKVLTPKQKLKDDLTRNVLDER